MIVANKPYTEQLYLQELTLFLFTSVYFDITESSEVQLIKSTLKKRNLRTKQWNPLSFRLFPLASMIPRSFQTVRRMREAWKGETYVRSQSLSSESSVKYLHVERRKIQISPPLGEQDQSNALPQGQQRQSNPHLMPRRLYIDRCIIFS